MSFNEARKILQAIKEYDNTIPDIINFMGNTAQTHFVRSFRDQGFTDETLSKWQPRKGELSGGIARVRKRSRDSGRAILVKTGALRRSIRKVNRGKLAVSIVSNLPYARVHNEGLPIRGGRMPKRQFVGHSKRVDRKIRERINSRITRIFK
jgi:phage gpG-like protein